MTNEDAQLRVGEEQCIESPMVILRYLENGFFDSPRARRRHPSGLGAYAYGL
jgi:hypothetical protein